MAKGTDTLAIRYADEHKLTKILFPANWKKYPLIAGFLRNEDMLSKILFFYQWHQRIILER